MRIRELTLTNYRAFSEAAAFRFDDHFTVIAGVNGRGKTAILDALALVLSRLLPQVSPARSGYRKIAPSEVHRDAATAQLVVKVNCAGFPIEYALTYDSRRRVLSAPTLPLALRREARKAYADQTREHGQAPLVVYYTTDRAGYRLPRRLPTEVPGGQAAAYSRALSNRTVNFRDLMARYRALITLENEVRENPDFLGQPAIAAISRALSTFLGGFTNLRVQEDPLRLLIDKEGLPLDLTQLSDGERSFLAVICDLGRRLALANPSLPNPLDGAGVVLIDEIELHLHPQWQLETVEKLRRTFPNIQFIATTHSPFIIQTLRSDELIVLDDLTVGTFENRGIEEIATKVMGITDPSVSPRYLEMLDAAKRYFEALETDAPASARAALRRRLSRLSRPYADNPAYQAFLEMERVKRFRE